MTPRARTGDGERAADGSQLVRVAGLQSAHAGDLPVTRVDGSQESLSDGSRGASADGSPVAPADDRARQLAAALAQFGVRAEIEPRDALAIIVLADDAPPLDAGLRRACVREAQRAGFTHVALEIAPSRVAR